MKMNRVAKEILASVDMNDALKHYGVSIVDGAPGPGSGRYPRGSGEKPNQHGIDFIERVKELRKSGMKAADIAKAVGFVKRDGSGDSTKLKYAYSTAVNMQRINRVKSAKAMLEDGKSRKEVCEHFGINESTLRSWLNTDSEVRTVQAMSLAEFLKKQVDEKGMIMVGAGIEKELNVDKEGNITTDSTLAEKLGVSRDKLDQALYILEEEGYVTYGGGVPQATNPGKQTNIQVLCPPGTEHKEIYNYDKINTINDYRMRTDENGEEHYEKGFKYPESMDSSRILIRYADDLMPNGHKSKEYDGTIEIRPNCPDLDLKNSQYAQVRILVDNSRYAKGIAFYSNDVPDGYDVVINSSKPEGQWDRVLKKISDDPNNPFGALLKEEGGQYEYVDKDGKRKLGLINKTREEGDWGEWSHDLPAQFLVKQSKQLMERQLNLSIADKKEELREIKELENPTVKKVLLDDYANNCEAAAEELRAAALPRQQYQLLMPAATLKDNEVYAPNYKDGETVALVRFPHEGTYQIPILKVNNKNPEAVERYGKNPADMVAVNSVNSERLSGADFDGDCVMVIPCNSAYSKVWINSTPPLKDLDGFDDKLEYGYTKHTQTTDKDGKTVDHYYRGDHEYKIMKNTQIEMGIISNLITDMTIKGATDSEKARATRHAMVVIDAEKHKLDYRQSYIDNGIQQLKEKYQKHYVEGDDKPHYGASTLISRAGAPVQVLKSRGEPKINQAGKPWYDPSKPEGALVYNRVVETYIDKKTGKEKTRMVDSTQMAETTDAHTLSAGYIQERIYANYANTMKALAYEARMEKLKTGRIEYKKNAKEIYRNEVNHLLIQLNECLKNQPRETKAQLATNSAINAMKKEHPDMKKKEIAKKRAQYLAMNRIKYGASRKEIDISPREYEAIQAGAISETTLTQILRFADSDKIRSYATPRTYNNELSPAKQARIKAMKASGNFTNADIAQALGVSVSSVNKYSG